MSESWSDILSKLRGDLTNLAMFIDSTRKGLDSIESTVKVGSEKFPEASHQLSAVTGDLENAANNIMNILEILMSEQDRVNELLRELGALNAPGGAGAERSGAVLKELSGINEKAKKEMMDIFTNLSFQDLTGQKLKKVISSLAVIEKKLFEMAFSFGFTNEKGEAASEGDALQGPTNPRPIDQSLVDKIMKELGT